MCKNCQESDLGQRRKLALVAAIDQCRKININPDTAGFLARHAWKGYTPQFSQEQRAALDAYNQAQQNIKNLHNDYVFGLARVSSLQRDEKKTLDELLSIKNTVHSPVYYCLCGSTRRAAAAFEREQLRLTLEGHIVLSIGVHKNDDELHLSSQQIEALDVLHLFKIEQADVVLILNVDGYIGKSTGRELKYAQRLGKKIEFLENPEGA